MTLQPPWASELRAKNRKVARNIWSTSHLPDRKSFVLDFEGEHGDGEGEKVVDPVSESKAPSVERARGETTTRTGKTLNNWSAESRQSRISLLGAIIKQRPRSYRVE
jgi:hypothetical protein